MRLFKRKRWIVKNFDNNCFAGKVGGWTDRRRAKRFRDRSDAQLVADILSTYTLADCRPVRG